MYPDGNPRVMIADKLCREIENKGICSGHGTCKLGMCLFIPKYILRIIRINILVY